MATFTYQTRIQIDAQQDQILSACAADFSMIERKLFADIQRDDTQNYTELKKGIITVNTFYRIRWLIIVIFLVYYVML